MQVKDVMSGCAVCVDPGETVAAAARLLSRHNVGALPVCGRDGRLRGVLTDRDIVLRCVAAQRDPNATKVSAVMSAGAVTASPEQTAAEAAGIMAARQIRRLPVTENGRVVGMLSLGDLASRPDLAARTAETFSDICSPIRTG